MKFKVMFNFLLQQMYCDRKGNGQKPTWTKPSTQKTPDKTPLDKNFRTIEIEFVQGIFVRDFVLGLLKIGGSEMCDVLSRGSRDVWQIVTGGGVKIGQK